MLLTSIQAATLKAAMLADANPTLVAARQAGNAQAIADYYNTASAFIVWRTSVAVSEMQGSYVWSEIIALTQGQFNALSLVQAQNTLNPSVANIRTGMAAIFTSSPNTLAALTALAKRAASNVEKLFATGTGTNGSPGILVVEGLLGAGDIAVDL